MAKQTSSRSSSGAPKRKTSEAPGPITKVLGKPENQAASGLIKANVPSAPTSQAGFAAPTHEAIAQRAYELYQTRSHHDGSELSDWLRAENDLRT
ncbi:MAG: hypothetical protein JWN48_1207 [Myxococcaceae bacterium]|nr:hypothetical protein [Myxococcaceae bacterium]